jgi:hypothetical protein
MKEFKGTKRKWEATKDNNVFSDGKIIFAHQSSCNNDERQSNAKLIASAPEMFEMLNKILDYNILNDLTINEEINELLTKITE